MLYAFLPTLADPKLVEALKIDSVPNQVVNMVAMSTGNSRLRPAAG